MISQGTESQKVAPSMKGHEVYSNGEEGWGEIKKKEQDASFNPSPPMGAGKSLQEEREEYGDPKKCIMTLVIRLDGIECPGGHELDDLPGFGKVKGEGSGHYEGSPRDREEEPADPRMKFK